jgi:hypothetical protein
MGCRPAGVESSVTAVQAAQVESSGLVRVSKVMGAFDGAKPTLSVPSAVRSALWSMLALVTVTVLPEIVAVCVPFIRRMLAMTTLPTPPPVPGPGAITLK